MNRLREELMDGKKKYGDTKRKQERITNNPFSILLGILFVTLIFAALVLGNIVLWTEIIERF